MSHITFARYNFLKDLVVDREDEDYNEENERFFSFDTAVQTVEKMFGKETSTILTQNLVRLDSAYGEHVMMKKLFHNSDDQYFHLLFSMNGPNIGREPLDQYNMISNVKEIRGILKCGLYDAKTIVTEISNQRKMMSIKREAASSEFQIKIKGSYDYFNEDSLLNWIKTAEKFWHRYRISLMISQQPFCDPDGTPYVTLTTLDFPSQTY